MIEVRTIVFPLYSFNVVVYFFSKVQLSGAILVKNVEHKYISFHEKKSLYAI